MQVSFNPRAASFFADPTYNIYKISIPNDDIYIKHLKKHTLNSKGMFDVVLKFKRFKLVNYTKLNMLKQSLFNRGLNLKYLI